MIQRLLKTTATFIVHNHVGSLYDRGPTGQNIILLNAFKDRYDFPELRRVALEEYRTGNLTW